MKICTQCGFPSELKEFNKDKNSKDGFQSRCRICCKINKTKWRQANLEREKIKRAEWYQTNVEHAKACVVAWRSTHSEQKRVKSSEWYQNNKEKEKVRMVAWQKANPDKMNAYNARRRASKLNSTPSWLTETQKEEVLAYYVKAKEMQQLTGILYHVDHIVPLQGKNVSGLHVPWNLQVIPASKNLRKYNKYS